MALITKVIGAKEIVKNLKKAGIKTGKQVEVGLKTAGFFLQRKSQEVVPVRYGILKNSAFTRQKYYGFTTIVIIGYTAAYAVYVHENLEAKHKPGKIAKYLEKPARENKDRILEIIAGKVKF